MFDKTKQVSGMKNRMKQSSAGVALELTPGGVLVVRMTGLLTVGVLLAIRNEITSDAGAHEVRAFVVDYTAAIVAMTGAELDQVLEGDGAGQVPMLPAAMVVSAECAELFGGHALRMAARGVMRRVFVTRSAALFWAQREALRVRR